MEEGYETTVKMPVVDALTAELKERKVKLLIVDPFVKSHKLIENSNEQIDFAASLWAKATTPNAQSSCCTISTRERLAEFRSVPRRKRAYRRCRAAVSLATMTTEEAKGMGIGEDERRKYVRCDNAKLNSAPPPTIATWLKLNGVTITNNEVVHAVSRWQPQAESTTDTTRVSIESALAAGTPDGQPWSKAISDAPRMADRSVLKVFLSHGVKTRELQQRILAEILRGTFHEAEYKHPPRFKPANGLRRTADRAPKHVKWLEPDGTGVAKSGG